MYLIFLAGSIVRMTGSGMGCPDWPKCFGYYIPPTSEEQITWKQNIHFEEGMIIIKNKELFVAKKNLKTGIKFNSENWESYKKHDYAKFNKYHTWTEYINRLVTVVAGIVFLFLLVGAYQSRKKNKLILILSLVAFFLMLFEAWLGKTVVDSNLTPTKITIHMVAGLVIIGVLLKLKFIISEKKSIYKFNTLYSIRSYFTNRKYANTSFIFS